jgi:hypothetical protein
MQLHECLQLAVSRTPIGLPGAMLTSDRESGDSFLPHVSIDWSHDGQSQGRVNYPIMSTLRCIVSEWGSNAQTNFYIPPEHYAGYSYLEDDGRSGRDAQRGTDTHGHGHHQHHTFVYAEEPSNLHPHHYEVYTMRDDSHHAPKKTVTSIYSSFNMTRSHGEITHERSVHHGQSSALAPHIRTLNSRNLHLHMTIPYIHPQLNIPVPPLHLPWFYGALCWSFALAGLVMLSLPQKWIQHGGGRVKFGRQEHYQRHWFPYRAFAWVLILWQVSSCFDVYHSTHPQMLALFEVLPAFFDTALSRVHAPSLQITST